MLAAFAAATLSSPAALAQISDDVVKIGVLTDMNGPASTPTGQGSVTAAQMAVDDFGGKVLGKPISVIVGDHQLKPDIGAAIARRWYDTEQVDLIVDVPVSAVGLAVQNVANEKKKMFITHSTGAADFHGKFCSPYAIQWVFDTHALAVGTAQEVVKRGGDSWFFITDDYAFGHSLEKDASEVVLKNGGKVIGSVRPPFATPDLSSFILQAQASKAKIIGIAGGPPNNVQRDQDRRRVRRLQGRPADGGAARADHRHPFARAAGGAGAVADDVVLLGHGRQDPRMVEALFRQDEPDADDVAGRRLFLGHALSADAIKDTGTDEPLKVAAKMREKPIEDFFARNGRLREDNLMVHDLMLVQVKKPGRDRNIRGTITRSSRRSPARMRSDRRIRRVRW